MSETTRADGSAAADAGRTVVIDLDDRMDRWRYACGNGHRDWDPTNGGIWCRTCSRQIGVDPHYHEVVDLKTEEEIPWSRVEIV